MVTRNKPRFTRESSDQFYTHLKLSIQDVISRHKEKAKRTTQWKMIIYPALYILFYILLLTKGSSLFWFNTCYGVMGLLVTLIVFNIVHDAVHHALFDHPPANKRAACLLDLLGGNSFVWGKRHVLYHHSFTNVPGWDIDIQQTKLLRFNPGQEYKKVYRYQHLYMPVLYLFYSLNWILVRDFKDFFSTRSLVKQKTCIPGREYLKLFIFKTLYLINLVLVPVLVLPHAWYHFLSAFILMHWLTSFLTLLVLLPSHLDEDAQFPLPDEHLRMADTWAIHQLKVTNDFGTNQPVLNFIMGGLNHHIAHHLFPTLNHNIIPHVTQKVVEATSKRGLPYKCYTLRQVMLSHFKLLKKSGQLSHFFEE